MASSFLRTRRRRERSQRVRSQRAGNLGSIPSTATVAFKQNNGMGYVMLNAATAKKYMLNKNDPIFHGGRKSIRRHLTRKN
jgi:hypothetical protein